MKASARNRLPGTVIEVKIEGLMAQIGLKVGDNHVVALISAEAARWLVDNRSIVAVGIDTPSIDRGQSTDFRAHVILYAESISGFENVANLSALPATGSYVVALPMKIESGSGGPLRIAAFLPKEADR